MSYYTGTVMAFSTGNVPRYWLPCNGQILKIDYYPQLHYIIGNRFGGDGKKTFALPDLRGRIIMGDGQSPEGSDRVLGEKNGTEQVEISVKEMPTHNHTAIMDELSGTVGCTTSNGNSDSPVNNCFAKLEDVDKYNNEGCSGECLNGASVEISGSLIVKNKGKSETHNNVQPSIGVNYCICYIGNRPLPNN